jgi:hypothetical protein
MPGFVSLHGRRIGLTSTGGIGGYINSTGGGSTAVTQFAQMWGSGMIETVSSAGATISNSGITHVSSDSTSGMAALTMSAPVAGVEKKIFFVTSATALTIETTAAGILFYGMTSTAPTGSSVLSIVGSAGALPVRGSYITLTGLNSTTWLVTGKTASVSS